MNFAEFAALCDELERTSSRLQKIGSASEYLRRLEPDEIRYGVAFLTGRPFPISDPRSLEIGPADKSPQQVTTLAELEALFERQFIFKSRRDPSVSRTAR